MDLHTKLLENRSALLSRWFEAVVQTYPSDTAQFLRRRKDAFANPVGASVREGLEGIIDALIDSLAGLGPVDGSLDRERVTPLLDRIVRIRAVQSFSSRDALIFTTLAGPIFLDVVGNLLGDKERLQLEGLGRDLLFLAFDIYVGCREKLWEIRLKDEQRRNFLLLRRAKLIIETEPEPVELPDLRDSDGLDDDNHQER
jgi:hypothetical protein